MTDDVKSVFVKCPKCEFVNRVVAAGVADAEMVTCSHCHAPINNWGKLKMLASGAEPAAAAAPTRH